MAVARAACSPAPRSPPRAGPAAARRDAASTRGPELLGSFGAVAAAPGAGRGTCCSASGRAPSRTTCRSSSSCARRARAAPAAGGAHRRARGHARGVARRRPRRGARWWRGARSTLARPDDLAPATMRLLGPWAVLLAGVAVLAAMMSTAASFLNLAAAARHPRPPGGARQAGARRPGRAGGDRAGRARGRGASALPSERTVALLGVAGWGFFTAALLPVFTVGLAWRAPAPRGARPRWSPAPPSTSLSRRPRPHSRPASSPASPAPRSGCSSSSCLRSAAFRCSPDPGPTVH